MRKPAPPTDPDGKVRELRSATPSVEKGDVLYVPDTPDGVSVTALGPAFEEQLALGREFMREYRDTFRALAR